MDRYHQNSPWMNPRVKTATPERHQKLHLPILIRKNINVMIVLRLNQGGLGRNKGGKMDKEGDNRAQ